jgi:hypothetical protein
MPGEQIKENDQQDKPEDHRRIKTPPGSEGRPPLVFLLPFRMPAFHILDELKMSKIRAPPHNLSPAPPEKAAPQHAQHQADNQPDADVFKYDGEQHPYDDAGPCAQQKPG